MFENRRRLYTRISLPLIIAILASTVAPLLRVSPTVGEAAPLPAKLTSPLADVASAGQTAPCSSWATSLIIYTRKKSTPIRMRKSMPHSGDISTGKTGRTTPEFDCCLPARPLVGPPREHGWGMSQGWSCQVTVPT
jgi:hypothetical protein